MSLLAADLQKQAKRIHLRTRRLVDGAFAGEYLSVFKGRGMEFAEVREYVPGDDVRTIDWNVTARLGAPHVKQYIEERELTVVLLVDLSASNLFGSGEKFKHDVIAELCAVLALCALRNNDKVGLILFTDRIERYVPPQKGKNRALRIVRELLDHQAQGRGTDIANALDFLNKVMHQRALVFVVSDFLAADFEKPLRIAQRKHDVVPVSVGDPREFSLPKIGLVLLQDLESGELIAVDSNSDAVREQYAQQQKQAAISRRRLFQGLGLGGIEAFTDEPIITPLLRYFRQRERR